MDFRSSALSGPAGLVIVALALMAAPIASHAQSTGASAATASPPAAAQAPSPDQQFTREELVKLLGPIALYPDDLLAQLLPACAYPIEIVQASRWLEKNKAAVGKGDFSGLDAQSWDPAVKALARFPDGIAKLNADLDATSDIGDAFVNQPKDVADVIQALRQQAQKSGALQSTPQQKVIVEKQGETNYIVIEPAEPGVIYVPTYDANVVYDSGVSAVGAGLIGFGLGVAVGAIIDNSWDWNRGWVYPPRWPGYPGYRPGYPGYPGYRPGGGNINIGNDINIGNGNTRPWRPDADRYRPGQGSKPGLAQPGARPDRPGDRPGGGVDRPGAADRPGVAGGGNRPGGADRPGAGQGRPGGERPSASPRPASSAKAVPKVQRPSPAMPSRPTAFSDVRYGGGAANFSQRGSMSRQSVARPPMRGGGGRGGGGGGRRR